MKKRLWTSLCLILAVLLFTGCSESLYMRDVEKLKEQKEYSHISLPEKTATPKPKEKQYTNEERNQLANDYMQEWSAVEWQLYKLTMSEDSNGVKRYDAEKALRKIDISRDAYGSQDLDYRREYYFNDEAMYFARLTGDAGEMRFYFHEGTLLRWIDEQGNSYDLEADHPDFKTYGVTLLSEANRLWEEFEADKVILNSYTR